MADYEKRFDNFSFNTSFLNYFEEDEEGNKKYTEFKEGDHVIMGGIICEYKRLSTKAGSTMAFIKVEDVFGQIEVIIFPKIYDKCRAVLIDEQIVSVSGRLQTKDNVVQIIADDVLPLNVEEETKTVEGKEYLGIIIPDDKTEMVDSILDVCENYVGEIPVIIAMEGKKFNSHVSIRHCDGLITELTEYVPKENLIFFKKK